jgi:hypothetical protein
MKKDPRRGITAGKKLREKGPSEGITRRGIERTLGGGSYYGVYFTVAQPLPGIENCSFLPPMETM